MNLKKAAALVRSQKIPSNQTQTSLAPENKAPGGSFNLPNNAVNQMQLLFSV
jgi:hypothetical protein